MTSQVSHLRAGWVIGFEPHLEKTNEIAPDEMSINAMMVFEPHTTDMKVKTTPYKLRLLPLYTTTHLFILLFSAFSLLFIGLVSIVLPD